MSSDALPPATIAQVPCDTCQGSGELELPILDFLRASLATPSTPPEEEQP